jgi:hypothetical protein
MAKGQGWFGQALLRRFGVNRTAGAKLGAANQWTMQKLAGRQINNKKRACGHLAGWPRNLNLFVEGYFQQFFNLLANVVPVVNRNMAHPELPFIFWNKCVTFSFVLEASGRNIDCVA